MKSYKLFSNSVLMLVLLASFLVSAPQSYAQSEQDWSVPVNLSLSGAATNPVMVVDLRGTIHIIWVDDIDGYKYARSADDGVSWTPAVSVNFPFDPKDPPPVLFSDVNGVMHLFWISRDSSLFYGQTTPVDLGNPGNWLTMSRLASAVLSFDVILDARGGLHLAYIRKATSLGNPSGVYYRNTNVGGGWTEAVKLYESEYFRSTKQDDAYVRIASSNAEPNQDIYVTWDNRAQKRVFMAISKNSGQEWSDAIQIKGPEDTGGIDSPFNLSVAASGGSVLLMWQVGEPGSSKCTLYSQWSQDGGGSWEDSVAVLGGRSDCPLGAKFIAQTSDYMTVLLAGEVSPTLVAWNGEQWSRTQAQTQLPSFSNPLTYDAILLGCRFDLITGDRLYVAGCDQGRGGDVWFLSRSLEPVADWFAPSVLWSEPVVLSVESKDPERISNFRVTPDRNGNIHAAWVQSSAVLGNESAMAIEYARWNGIQWTNPEAIITSMGGMPAQLLLTSDSLERLLLTWIDGYYGDLVFSWADLGNAGLASEWVEVSGLPSLSQLVQSSDMVVDGSGRIISAYAISVNESRGVYVVQSTDNGKSWSAPVLVFDAVSASWERIENPHISLAFDGTLHLIFVRSTVRDGQPVGLYYSRSTDGGMTWSEAQILSEGEVQWADISSYSEQTLHVVWQEYDGLVFANISQVSKDGGLTWGKQNNVTGVNDVATQVSLASDGSGLLHFIQLTDKNNAETYNQKSLVLQDWKWDGQSWNLEITKDIIIKGDEISYSLSSAITANGFLGVFVPVEYTDLIAGFKSEILTFNRYLEDAGNGPELVVPVVPTSVEESNENVVPVFQPTSTPDFSILYDDNVSTSPFQRNIVGIILIGIGIVATIFLLMRRGSAKREE